ncbi:hypothetical protein VC81_01985 [Levilactobacillus spicheri]|uniref:Uncharacterized protein n=1 Tax=Levilactobacillus spicheri TaxID=216463 RepID=A0A0F3RWW3_9LACO|nr:hypothetical protein VC81_01985 [Levilactobacillus spicheri]
MEITFNESFASNLTQALHRPVIGLPLDLQLGDLHRFENAQAPFWTTNCQIKRNFVPKKTSNGLFQPKTLRGR